MIDAALAAFLQEGLSIYIATRNDRLEPNGAKGIAALVDADGVHVDVFVPELAIGRLKADLESNGRIAVVLCRPTDDRTCQIKGTFVSVRPARESEHKIVAGQSQRYRDNLDAIGLPYRATDGWVIWPAVAVRLKADALFNQTPGADAGQRIA